MKIKFIFLFAFVVQLNAQNLDSLYEKYLVLKGVKSSSTKIANTENEFQKCSFGIVNAVRLNFNNFSPKQKQVLSTLLQRPNTDTSFVSPSGKFRIHFNKTGNNKPGYDLNEFAKAADSAYNFEVNKLKYPPPPPDNNEGGDNRYDIYIQNLVSGLYGYTELETNITANTYTSYSVIDNDFLGNDYATHGISAAKATVAHEFHHGIQIGNYIYRESDVYFHEITSTAMEEFVYDDVNDYLAYLPSYFRSPNKAINLNNGYNLAIWNIFLRDRFGFDVIKEIWEMMPQKRAVECFDLVLAKHGSSLKMEFNTFGLWTYFTGSRAIQGKYFNEAANFPLISSTITDKLTLPSSTVKITSEPISNNFIELIDGPNTITNIISNVDIKNSVAGLNSTLPFDFMLATKSGINYRKLGFGYYSKIESSDNSLLAETNIINNIPLNEGQISVEVVNFAYPQPFSYKRNSKLFLPASLNTDGYAEVLIYSSSMNLVYSSQKRIVASEKIVVEWDGLDNNNQKLASGVYFYIVKCGDDIQKGKIVIYND